MSIGHQRLTIFGADDETPLLGTVVSGVVTVATCTTDPAGPRPYLQRVYQLAESNIDFINGSSDIGLVKVTVLDKRTSASDQRTGWFTDLLSDSAGNGQISGYRCMLEQQDETGAWYVVMNGIVGDCSMADTLVEYDLEVRDMRERERKNPIFNRSNGVISLFPLGLVNGYGNVNGWTLLINPVRGIKAKFTLDPTESRAGIAIASNGGADLNTSDKVMQLSLAQPSDTASSDGTFPIIYKDVKVRWRAWGSTGAWTTLTNMPWYKTTTFSTWLAAVILRGAGLTPTRRLPDDSALVVMSNTTTSNLPSNGQDIEIQVIYVGPTSAETPVIVECSFGQLLKDIYDGVYSSESPRIIYDATAMAAMVTNTPQARAKITDPVDDLRTWVQDNIYKVCGYAPALNAKGEITPIKYAIPDASVSLVQLDDTNCHSVGWKHSYKDTFNKVIFNYIREIPAALDDPTQKPIFFDRVINERPVEFVAVHGSASIFGPKVVQYDPVTVRSFTAVGTNDPLTGNVLDETGTQLAIARTHEVFDRFAYGAQRITGKAMRVDPVVGPLKIGDWVQIASSSLPDYLSGHRNINRIGQIVTLQDLNAIERSFELIDGGPFVVPLIAPTIGTIVVNGERVAVPISTIPAGITFGAFARVDYAVSPTLPATSSGEWILAGRTASAGTTIYTPTLPVGAVVWIRFRSEAFSHRPSVWSTPVSITIPALPVIKGASLDIHDGSNPIVNWTPDLATFGWRIWYQTFQDGTSPVAFTNFIDVRSDLGTATLPGTMRLRQFENILIAIDPYDGWTGTAVTGSHGTRFLMKGKRLSDTYIEPQFVESKSQTSSVGTLTLVENDPQYRINDVEFRHQVGVAGSFSSWTPDSTSPFSDTVSILSGDTSSIEYRVYVIQEDGTAVLRVTSQANFVDGSAGDEALIMKIRQSSAGTHTEILDIYIADPTPTAGNPITITATGDGVAAIAAPDGTQVATLTFPGDAITNDIDTTVFAQFTITRPDANQSAGMVSLVAKCTGRRSASASVPIYPTGFHGEPEATLSLEAEASSHDGDREGLVHVIINFEPNTRAVALYASESEASGDAYPDITQMSQAGFVERHEGVTASDDNYVAEFDIATTPDWFRQIIFTKIAFDDATFRNSVGGIFLRLPDYRQIQASDSGTPPSAPPSTLSVTMTSPGGIPRATLLWANGDASAHTRITRNGIILTRVAPGATTFVDDGLSAGIVYNYRIQHIKNGQTTAYAGGSGGGTSDTPTLVAPTWVTGFPVGGTALIGDASLSYVNVRVANPDPLAYTDVYMSPGTTDTGSFTFVGNIAPGATDLTLYGIDFSFAVGTVRWFYLKASRSGYTDSVASAHATATFNPDY